ncbi:ESX-1 secreted protein, EspB [Mycobacterium europaeum]|uniref:ESX-1 secreted protein, EspB n=1 Tax=Mycobacterium europaeum TaxID=761804 RepID=A0A0U1CZN6_9MYCO|nr:hypothetical protein [Mycobacterium europaeum]ORV57645.1 hypothetical protein AWC03_15435 [Mycobacterium europaeum]CQD05375.1 ESX-1 secreted protein, EspB [Mycobacterium europaeum]
MTQTLNVEYQELIARAEELEQPLPTVPSTNPQGPCNLSFIHDTAARLAFTADTFRMYLKGCEREWKSLAKSLRNAAKAYEEVDTGAAEDIDKILTDGSSAAAMAPVQVVAEEEPWSPPPPAAAAAPFEYPYYEVRRAAADIESGDQGTAFRAFAQEWESFQRALREQTNRFRLFNSWEGEATAQVEQNFQRQKEWIYSMAKLCGDLAQQANRVVDVHKKATATTGYNNQHALDGAHPTSYEISQCDYWYRRYMESNNQYYVTVTIQWYEKLQATSESALKYYVQYANLPLKALTPDTPPKATVIKPPDKTPKPNPGDPNAENPNPDDPDASPKPEPKPTPGGGTPTPGGGTPTPAQIGQLAGNISQGMQGFSEGMQGATQGVQGIMQGIQGFAQGGGSMPASLASDTTAIDPQADAEKKDDDKKDDEETQDQATLVDGAAAGDQASGAAPTAPPAAGGQAGAAPSEVVL